MLLSLISISFAQELEGEVIISKDAQGLECSFTEPFLTFRYHFQSQRIVGYGMDSPVMINSAKLDRKETKNPFLPEYQLKINNSSASSFSVYIDNSGSDGMSGRFYPISVSYNSLQGGCFFISNLGTHVVTGVFSDPEPWLNLRKEGSSKADILGKLYQGTEVNILETKNGWAKIQVVTSILQNQKGWVSMKYLTKISS